jgi:hypothetical protein
MADKLGSFKPPACHGHFKIVLGSVLAVRGRGDVTFCRDLVSAWRT